MLGQRYERSRFCRRQIGRNEHGTKQVDDGGYCGTTAVIWRSLPAAQRAQPKPIRPGGECDVARRRRSGLQYMREEEAARCPLALYEEWQLPIFRPSPAANRSTWKPCTLIEVRPDRSGGGQGCGEFTIRNCKFMRCRPGEQAVDALKVGATIEDLDIADLMAALENDSDESLRHGEPAARPENHLRRSATWNERVHVRTAVSGFETLQKF